MTIFYALKHQNIKTSQFIHFWMKKLANFPPEFNGNFEYLEQKFCEISAFYKFDFEVCKILANSGGNFHSKTPLSTLEQQISAFCHHSATLTHISTYDFV